MPSSLACIKSDYFYPRPPRGGRRRPVWYNGFTKGFLSTPSARRATKPLRGVLCIQNISIHALREEGDADLPVDCHGSRDISIHALREEGDQRFQRHDQRRVISIHALREEGDRAAPKPSRHRSNFYPRPPRGGRREQARKFIQQTFISIHALREEGDILECHDFSIEFEISIHALREEGDT